MDPATLDFDLCRLKPYAHQEVGVSALVRHPFFALFDEMGAGKTKQVIDSAQFLFEANEIDRVITLAPAAVRNVWYDPDLGELAKHLWTTNFSSVAEFHTSTRAWAWNPSGKPNGRVLQWIITNYEFIRSKARLEQLKMLANYRTLLVCDESSMVKNHKAEQSKATLNLRGRCGRVVILNGTPVDNSPMDLYSQAKIMSSSIFAHTPTYYQFRARYAVMGGFMNRQIVKYQNLGEIQKLMAPYVLRRLKKDCLDLPEKQDPVILTAVMSGETWKTYKNMRDEMVVWLNDSTISVANQAIVKAMRLAQICSGFLGGVTDEIPQEAKVDIGERPSWLPGFIDVDSKPADTPPREVSNEPVQEISTEKLGVFLDFLKTKLADDPEFKLLVWCRFRPQVAQVVREVGKIYPNIMLGEIRGGQKRDERDEAMRLLDPRSTPKAPVVVVGTPSTGSMGLNLTASNTVVYMSNDYRLMTRKQSEDRVHRPGQTRAVSYYDVVAVGPAGQRTIDHGIIKALRNKDDLATWTTSAWLKALEE